MNDDNKKTKAMHILVNENDIEEPLSINNEIPKKEDNFRFPSDIHLEDPVIDLEKNLLGKNEEIKKLNEPLIPLVEKSNEKHKFFLKIFIILIVQYSLILLFSFLGFFYKFNEILLEKFPIGYELALDIGIYSILSICFNELLPVYNKKIFKILILTFYSIITIFFSFSLSNYFETKYIIIGLSLITLNILSLLIISIFIKKYTLIIFCSVSSIFSFIGLILFSALWIKSLLQIIFVSLFWIISIGYQLCWFLFNMKYCRIDESFNSSIIYNNAVFLVIEKGISFVVKYINKYIQNKITHSLHLNVEILKIFSILLVQHVIIIIFVWIGFSLGWNEGIKENEKNNGIVASVGMLLYLFYFLITIILTQWFKYNTIICHILHIIYIPIMIENYFAGTAFKNVIPKHILSFLFIIVFGLLSINLFIFYTEKTHFLLLPIISLLANAIIIVIFHFFWLKDLLILKIYLITFTILNVGFCITFYILSEYLHNYLILVLYLDLFHFTFIIAVLFIPLLPCIILNIKREKNENTS